MKCGGKTKQGRETGNRRWWVAFELWCWRRRFRVPWTARRSNQSILKEISPEYSLEGLMLKLQYFGHLMPKTDSVEKTLMLRKTEGRRKTGWQRRVVGWHHQLDAHEFEQAPGVGDGQGGLVCCSSQGCKESDVTEQLNWTELKQQAGSWGGDTRPEAKGKDASDLGRARKEQGSLPRDRLRGHCGRGQNETGARGRRLVTEAGSGLTGISAHKGLHPRPQWFHSWGPLSKAESPPCASQVSAHQITPGCSAFTTFKRSRQGAPAACVPLTAPCCWKQQPPSPWLGHMPSEVPSEVTQVLQPWQVEEELHSSQAGSFSKPVSPAS